MLTNFLTKKNLLLSFLFIFGILFIILLFQLHFTSSSNHNLKEKIKTLKIENESLEDTLKMSIRDNEKLYEKVMNLTELNQICKDEMFKNSFLLKNCKCYCLNEG